MSWCKDRDEVKEEPGVFYEQCEKEEPDLVDNCSIPTCGFTCVDDLNVKSDVENCQQYCLVVNPKQEFDCELPSCSSNVVPNLDFENNDFKVKLEVDECTSFNSYDFSFVSENPDTNVKRLNVVVDEQGFDLEELFGCSGRDAKLNKNLFHCHHCVFSSKFRGNLIRHIKYQHMASHFLSCKICGLRFRFKCELVSHYNFYHEKFEKRVSWKYCNFCPFKTDKRYNIFRHMYKDHAFRLYRGFFDEIKKCNFCSYRSDLKPDLLNHFINIHEFEYSKPKRKRNFYCGLCPYFTDSNSTLISHIDGYHKKIRPYSCHLCEYSAARPTDLKIHISAKHDKITPYKCDTCGYASAYKKHLVRHIFSQHIKKKKRKNCVKRSKLKASKIEKMPTFHKNLL